MKFRIIILALAVAMSACAQGFPQESFAAVMTSYQAGGSPAFTGSGFFAWKIAPDTLPNTYQFDEYDVYAKSWKPFVLNNVVRAGVYQEVVQYGKLRSGICVDAGGGTAGSNGVGSIGGCGLAFYQIGSTKWYAAGMVSGVKTALSDPTVVYKIGIRRDM